MYSRPMATTSISISTIAYQRLAKLKQTGDSFSDVLLRELPEPCETCGDVEAHFRKHGVPEAEPHLRRVMLSGRGRRSNRRRA